jgi:saccharopine dehydrogenase (NADP+, L-glutamate forming)
LKDGEVVNISPEDLLTEGTERKDYMKSLHLEGYPNRDSLKFKESFGFKDAKTFIRGTLRYGGFGVIMRALHQIGYTDSNIALDHSKIKTIRDFAEYLAEGFEPKVEGLEDVFEKANINKVEDQKLFSRLIQKLIQKDDLASILSSWVFFELLNSKREITEDMKTALDVMSVISLEKMSYKDGERDFVAMKHIFDIEEASGEKKTIHSTMMVCGDKTGSGGMSIMAKTVGYTSAIAVNLILEGKITRKGVISPKTEDIYSKILPILEEDGITVVEEYK